MKLNALGLIGMILSLVGLFVFPIPFGIAGLVCGSIGLVDHDAKKGMAIAGMVIGIADIVYGIIVVAVAASIVA